MPSWDRTSIELPNALSGSNELMTCPGVASTRMIDDCSTGLSAMDWAAPLALCATENKRVIKITAQFHCVRTRTSLQRIPRLTIRTAVAIAALRTLQAHCALNLTNIRKDTHPPFSGRDSVIHGRAAVSPRRLCGENWKCLLGRFTDR